MRIELYHFVKQEQVIVKEIFVTTVNEQVIKPRDVNMKLREIRYLLNIFNLKRENIF